MGEEMNLRRAFNSPAQFKRYISRVGQNELLYLYVDAVGAEFAQGDLGDLLRECLDQFERIVSAKFQHPPGKIEIIDGVVDFVCGACFREVTPQRYRYEQALRVRAFFVRHADPAEDSEVFDRDRIHLPSIGTGPLDAQSELFRRPSSC